MNYPAQTIAGSAEYAGTSIFVFTITGNTLNMRYENTAVDANNYTNGMLQQGNRF